MRCVKEVGVSHYFSRCFEYLNKQNIEKGVVMGQDILQLRGRRENGEIKYLYKSKITTRKELLYNLFFHNNP
jgi:hypothetical protein